MPSQCFHNFFKGYFFCRHRQSTVHLPPVPGEDEITAFEIWGPGFVGLAMCAACCNALQNNVCDCTQAVSTWYLWNVLLFSLELEADQPPVFLSFFERRDKRCS